MKRKTVVFFSALLLLLLPILGACSKKIPEPAPRPTAETGKLETTVFVCSDIHLLSDTLVDELSPKTKLTSDGRCQELDVPLLEALVDIINEKRPEFFVITGDLSFNGETESHKAVIEILRKVGEHTRILVIPGNHDYNNLYSSSYTDAKITPAETPSPEEFRELYRDFGYDETDTDGVVSFDSDSLSYCRRLSDSLWGLFLDTNLSKYNLSEGMQTVGGSLSGNTFEWLEGVLREAKAAGVDVISFTHHNLLVHHTTFKSRYTLGNAPALLDLYSEYGVKLNFSGHLHVQSIKELDGFCDVASSSLIDYGCRYGMIEIYDNAYSYKSETLTLKDVDVPSYTFKKFRDMYYNKQHKNDVVYGKRAEEVASFISDVNCYYFDGNGTAIRELINSNLSLYRLIMKKNSSDYIKEILQTAEYPDSHELVIERH